MDLNSGGSGEQHATIVNTQTVIEIYTDGDQNECLTGSFTTMRIINSVRAPWPIVEMHFLIDNQPMIEKNIFGASDIEVYIWYVGEDGIKIPDPMIWNLLYLESNIELPQKPKDNGPWDDEEEGQRRNFVISCLSKPSFLTMSAFVNRLWEGDDTGMIPLDIIKELLSLKGIESRIFDDGKNEDTIPQLIIPPMTMKSATDFVNEKFGIFKGPTFRYANYAGQFCMWDLKERWELTKDTGFTKTHKMPGFSDDVGLFEEINDSISENPDEFLTYDHVQTIHYGNASIVKNGYDNIYITHPHEDIAFFHKWNTDDIISDFGLWHDNDELKYHDETKIRKKYYYDWKGFEVSSGYSGTYNDNAMTNALSDLYKSSAAIKFTIYRKVKISLVSRVGEVVYLKPYSYHELFPGSNYEGAYLITDSEIILTKESKGTQDDNIEIFATITACRSVQSKD